jgi:tetratricopeptide (TPR) repeat protein
MMFMGRLDDAFVLVERALALRPDPNLAIARWSIARINGNPRTAEYESVARSMAAPQQLLFADANLAVWDGRLSDYRRIIEQLQAQARGSSETELTEGIAAGEMITLAVVQRGDWIPKVKALIGQNVPPQGVAQIAASLAVIGEIDTVRAWVPRLEGMDPNDPQQMQPALVARALVMAADGRGREGSALVESYLAQNPRSLELHYYVGLIRERSGAIDDAIGSYRMAVQSANVLGPNPAVMSARLGLAQLLKQKGDTAGANEHFDALLKQWEKADADFRMLQVVKDARAGGR